MYLFSVLTNSPCFQEYEQSACETVFSAVASLLCHMNSPYCLASRDLLFDELLNFSYLGSTYSSSQSPEDNDRTELLKQSEPVDYTSDTVDNAEESLSINSTTNTMRYQSRPGPSRPTRYSSNGGRSTIPPPRGIFDDI